MQNFQHGEKLTRWYHSVDDTKDTDDTKVLKNFTATYLTNSLLSNICLMTGPWTAPKNFPTCTTQCTAEWNKEHEVLLNSRSFWFWFCFCFIVCYAMLCYAVLCCAVLCCAVLCCAALCCAVLCCAVLCCAVLCCDVIYLFCFISFCTVVYCTVLYCSALFCVILRFKNPTLSYKVKVEMQSQKVRSLNLTVLQTSKPKKCVKNWKEPLV